MTIDRTKWRVELRSRLIPETQEYGLTVQDGWRDLICDLVDRIETSGMACRLFQVKEKFGGLRFYMATEPGDTISGWIEEAEKQSWSICDGCGAIGGEHVSGGWVRVVCQPCFKKWDEERYLGNVKAKA